ncbi:amphi-Trp domain-containing protein [Haladaptatus sp. NG-WS-4]
MVERTSFDTEISRSETADLLRRLADELDSESEVVTVEVGNKRVRLSPPETIDAEVEVTERSRILRKDIEKLNLDLQWKPVKNTTGADSRTNGQAQTESKVER